MTRYRGERLLASPHNPQKVYKLRAHQGKRARIPAAPTYNHINHLQTKHLTLSAIARASGVGETTIQKLVARGPDGIVDFRIARAILAVTHTPHPRQIWVPTVGLRRRALALARLGWPLNWQATQVGLTQANYLRAIHARQANYKVWAAIRDLYDQYSGTPGPSSITRKYAERKRWQPPLVWEGIDIDDPDVYPQTVPQTDEIDPVAVDRLAAGEDVNHTPAELTAAFERLNAAGLSAAEISDRLRMSARSVFYRRNRDRVALREAA